MSKELTVILLAFFALLADVLCIEHTIIQSQNFASLTLAAIFGLEISAAVLRVCSIYYLTRIRVFKNRRFSQMKLNRRRRFSLVSFLRFDRSGFLWRFWKRQTPAPKV